MTTDAVSWPVPGEPGAQWRARAFGEGLDDLSVDLRSTMPFATTDVLSTCLTKNDEPVTPDEAWAWTVNRRLQGLLAVAFATRGDHWTITTSCTGPDCGEPMDLPLRLRDFRRSDDPLRVAVPLGRDDTDDVVIPTGNHQRSWVRRGLVGPAAEECMARELSTTSVELPPECLHAIEDALAEADPLTALEIRTRCPECGSENRVQVNLERECLLLLLEEQPRLLDDIHRLALAYHWSEREILTIGPARRREYLSRLGDLPL